MKIRNIYKNVRVNPTVCRNKSLKRRNSCEYFALGKNICINVISTHPSFFCTCGKIYFHLFNDASWIVEFLKKLDNILMIKTWFLLPLLLIESFQLYCCLFAQGVLFFLLLFNINLMAIVFLDSKYNRPL